MLRSVNMRFRNGVFTNSEYIFINGTKIYEVKSVKYLGINIMYNLNEANDISRARTAFLKQFYSFSPKFSRCKLTLKLNLFNIYCTSFYGSALWADTRGATLEYKAIKVCCHKGLKKLIGVPYWYSNHDVCNFIGFKTFDNLVNLNIFSFLFQIKRSISPCLLYIRNFLINQSKFARHANQMCANKYGFSDILSNDSDAIKSCIQRLQSEYVSVIPYDRLLGLETMVDNVDNG